MASCRPAVPLGLRSRATGTLRMIIGPSRVPNVPLVRHHGGDRA